MGNCIKLGSSGNMTPILDIMPFRMYITTNPTRCSISLNDKSVFSGGQMDTTFTGYTRYKNLKINMYSHLWDVGNANCKLVIKFSNELGEYLYTNQEFIENGFYRGIPGNWHREFSVIYFKNRAPGLY